MKIFEKCPFLENEKFLMRMVADEDCDDLLTVYSDKNALPFFNSDNCNGDIFYYNTKKKMMDAISFWRYSYDNQWFARLSIVEKTITKVIGTIELCYRVSEDAFNGMAILRLDVRSDYENEATISDIISLIVPQTYDLVKCTEIITKAPSYAIERISALQKFGFVKSEYLLKSGRDGYAFNGYWTIKK